MPPKSPWLVLWPDGLVCSRHTTRERAEQVAVRRGDGFVVALAGERARPERLGRPPVSGETRSAGLRMRCTPEELARWSAGAAGEGRDLTAVVREMVDARFPRKR